jgi:hypothetical protein
MRRAPFYLTGGLVCLVVLTVVFKINDENPNKADPSGSIRATPVSTAPPALPSMSAASEMRENKSATLNAPSAAAAASVILPPLNTKVKDVIAELKADAERGVPQAACRVGAELTRCWQVKQRLAIRDQVLSRLGSMSPDSDQGKSILSNAAGIASSVQSDKDLCQGVEDNDMQDAWRYLLKAALGGNAAAQAQFAINPPLSPNDPVGSLDGWAAYQQYSQNFLRRAIESGNIRALYLGFFSAASGLGPGGQAIAGRDPYQALAYGNALLPLVDAQTAQQIQAALPQIQAEIPAQASRAAQEGQDLRTKFFGGKVPVNVSSNLGGINPGGCSQ